jgi:hypothetical protein
MLLKSRTYVTLEARRDVVTDLDLGEYRAQRIKADAERRGYTLGEGVIRWHRIGDLRAQANAKGERCIEPEFLRDDDWMLEIMLPVVEIPPVFLDG